MKHLFAISALTLGVLALSSCSKNEILESVDTNSIGFKAMTDNVVKAAGEITTANITAFRVIGGFCNNNETDFTQTFNTQLVQKNNGTWEYSPLQYWAASKDYYFMAFSTNELGTIPWSYELPAEANILNAITSFESNKGMGTIKIADDGTHDLVYAYAKRVTDANITDYSRVSLSFSHLLSRLRFKITNSVGNTYSLKIENLKLGNSIKSASLNFGTSPHAWVADDDQKLSINFPTANMSNIANTAVVNSDPRFIIPGSNQTLQVTFDATLYTNGSEMSKKSFTLNVTSQDFEIAHSYELSINITLANMVDTTKPIEFTVTEVTGWPEWSSGDVTDVTIE